MPLSNKHQNISHIEIYNVQGTVKKTKKSVVFELNTGSTILDLHFGDPTQLMNFFVMMMEEMATVFPDHEASKLWLDDSFK